MPNNYKEFDLENAITLYNCKMIISDKYQEPVISELDKETNYIYINTLYARNEKDKLHQQLLRFIKNYQRSKIEILSPELINNEILEAIANNPKITSVTLGNPNDIYILTRGAFDILDKSESIYNINTDDVTGEYTNSERERISFFTHKRLVDVFTYQMLNDGRIIHLTRPLANTDINNLRKYSKKGIKIYFGYNDKDNILKIIEVLKGRNIEFRFMSVDILKDNVEAFKVYGEENIVIDRSVSLNRFLEVEKLLDLMVKDIKESTLSPYEKYLAVFKIVKEFKMYRSEGTENQYNTSASCDLYEILFSDYIVCLGFSELMIALLKRVGIYATFFHVEILKESERLTKEDYATLTRAEQSIKKGTKGYHSRIIFRLVDSKYDIDGIFISDVTWDQEEDLDIYNHSSLTPYETRFESDAFYNTPDDIFDIQSGTEFYVKIKKVPESIPRFLEIVDAIDKPFYNYLDKNYDIDGPYNTEFFIEIYNYIILHTNKRIPKETLFTALREVIKLAFTNISDEELETLIASLNEDYEDEQNISFIPEGNSRK